MISELLNNWFKIIVDTTIKGTVILLICLVPIIFHMNYASKHKHRFLLTSFSVFVFLPLLKLIQQLMGLPLLNLPFSADKTYLASPLNDDFSTSAGQISTMTLPETFNLFNKQNLLFFIWLGGFIFLIARLLVGLWKLDRICRASDYDKDMLDLCNSIKDELKLGRQVKLYKNPVISSPVTYGILKPVILIPDDFFKMPDECKRVAIMHELLHIKRMDQFTGILSQLILACYWFNPIIWIAVRQLRNQQEEACDECVLQMGVAPHDYAANMLQIVREYRFNRLNEGLVSQLVRKDSFERRILHILKPSAKFKLSRNQLIMLSCLVLLAIPLLLINVNAAVSVPKFSINSDNTTEYPISLPIMDIGDGQELKLHSDNRSVIFETGPVPTTIIASADGEVTDVRQDLSKEIYTIEIKHKDGLNTVYSNIREVYVSKGQKVCCGDVLGSLSHEYQLKYSIKYYGTEIDTIKLLKLGTKITEK